MSQKSSLPQAAKSVSQVLTSDTEHHYIQGRRRKRRSVLLPDQNRAAEQAVSGVIMPHHWHSLFSSLANRNSQAR
jgi:hypothetical protein